MAVVVRLSVLAVALTLVLAAAPAHANPDVWVRAAMTVAFEDRKVSELAFTWRFDDFFSAHAIGTYDADRDGTLEPAETDRLRAETFDPLAGADYHVHVWAAGGRREAHRVERFAARIEESRLVYAFSVPLAPPADPHDAPVTVSLHDPETVVDFRRSESGFLLVGGEMAAGCDFRVARGSGAQSGHPQPVTLSCEG